MDIKQYMERVGRKAREASRVMASASTADKDQALQIIADIIEQSSKTLLVANKKDMDAGSQNGLDSALLDRLMLLLQRKVTWDKAAMIR